jgi:uncharacterized protein DUF6152
MTSRSIGNPARHRRWIAWIGTAALSAVTTSVFAHHSVAGQFDATKRTRLTGTITAIEWINPHTYIHLDVKDEQGTITSWRLESLPTAMMHKAGLTKAMIMGDGSPVTADAMVSRDGTRNVAWVMKLTYADGHYYQLAGE